MPRGCYALLVYNCTVCFHSQVEVQLRNQQSREGQFVNHSQNGTHLQHLDFGASDDHR